MAFETSQEQNNGVISMLGNGIIGIQRESNSKVWERRAPLTPSHCAQLLHAPRRSEDGHVKHILVQPSTKRIFQDTEYENVGCEISEDLSKCGLILGVKQPEVGTLLPNRAYAFFSHTHKAQRENMPLLDEILSKHISLYDYERIVGDKGERLVAFGAYAGRAGMIDLLRGLGTRYLSLGYSTPFLSIGSSFMYASLSAAKAAVLQAGEEIRTNGLPSQISPLVFIFTGTGKVSQGAQEIFRLLPHKFVDPSELPKLSAPLVREEQPGGSWLVSKGKKRTFEVYGCIVTAEHMVAPTDSTKKFDKNDYYSNPGDYYPIFHEKVAPYASIIVNCMYWEKKYPRLLTNDQLQTVANIHKKLIAIADITCDIGGSIECITHATSNEKPFYLYDPSSNSCKDDLNGDGIVILATDNLPTELPRESTNHFGEVLLPFVSSMGNARSLSELLHPVQCACIAHEGKLTVPYEYIHSLRCERDAAIQQEEAE